jgi:hypothetical protein
MPRCFFESCIHSTAYVKWTMKDAWCTTTICTKCTLTRRCFYLTEKQQKIYPTKFEEQGPEQHTRHKSHITKVMFLTAVAKSCIDAKYHCTFEQATIVLEVPWKQKQSTWTMRFTWIPSWKQIAAIKAKFPRESNPNIMIGFQCNNAPEHFEENNPEWIKMVTARSPVPPQDHPLLWRQPEQTPHIGKECICNKSEALRRLLSACTCTMSSWNRYNY